MITQEIMAFLEQVILFAPGTKARYSVVFGYKGTGKNRDLELFDSIPTSDTPFVIAETGFIKAISFGAKVSTNATFSVLINDVVVETLSAGGLQKANKKNLLIPVAELDEIRVSVDNNNVRDPVFNIFIQTTAA